MPKIWLWNTKWLTVAERCFLPVEVPSFNVDRLLVVTRLIHSRTEAQRLITAGTVSWRRADDIMEWVKVTSFKQELAPGWPWVLRIGNGHWRTVMVVKDVKTVPESLPALATVMRPEEHQTIEAWTEIWK